MNSADRTDAYEIAKNVENSGRRGLQAEVAEMEAYFGGNVPADRRKAILAAIKNLRTASWRRK